MVKKITPLWEVSVVIKGAGDLASGIACRLYRANIRRICMLEIEAPLAVRRAVAFCEAVYEGRQTVEGIQAVRVAGAEEVSEAWDKGKLAVLVDPQWHSLAHLRPDVVVDAILAKKNRGTHLGEAPLVIGLGPGFHAGRDVHRVIETHRGPHLGRVLTNGCAQANTGIPGKVAGYGARRVFRSPQAGRFETPLQIGTLVREGDIIGTTDGVPVSAQIDGVLRGLIRPGLPVSEGIKLGDIDPRGAQVDCNLVSDKARALGGSVLEAILSEFNC